MSPITAGIIIFVGCLILLLSGIPIWAGLTLAAFIAIVVLSPSALPGLAYVAFSGIDSFALLAIPLFILMAAPIANSAAGFDLYEAIHRWLYRVPGAIGITNMIACAIFAALCGSSPATAAAIGGMGIPEMRRRGYPPGFACGLICVGGTLGILIPPSVTMIVYGVATETSIGKCFIAGIIPGVIVAAISCGWIAFYYYFFVMRRRRAAVQEGESKACISEVAALPPTVVEKYTWKQRMEYLPKIVPFLILIFLVTGSLYLGWASPSEAAGLGAAAALVLCASIYRVYHREQMKTILGSALNESTMVLMILVGAALFGWALSQIYATQAMAESIVALPIGRWGIMAIVNGFLLILGMFVPPVAVILMVAPILLKILLPLGFDPVWFAVVVTLNMEIGLVSPPVGINLYIVKGIAPDISMGTVLKGSLPFLAIVVFGIVLVCIFPQLALWLPGTMIGR